MKKMIMIAAVGGMLAALAAPVVYAQCCARNGAGGMGPGGLMGDVHTLGFKHAQLSRSVEAIPGGVKARTTSADPVLVPVLRKHPREMWEHLEAGGMVRMWDPLFAELIAHHEAVEMTFDDVENGIEITATTDDPEVEKLLHAHAVKVSDFVNRGPLAMQEATPLPEGYTPQGNAATAPGAGNRPCAARGQGARAKGNCGAGCGRGAKAQQGPGLGQRNGGQGLGAGCGRGVKAQQGPGLGQRNGYGAQSACGRNGGRSPGAAGNQVANRRGGCGAGAGAGAGNGQGGRGPGNGAGQRAGCGNGPRANR